MKINKLTKTVTLVSTLVLLMAGITRTSYADTIVRQLDTLNFGGNGASVFSDTFTMKANGTVDALGYFDRGDGNYQDHMVGLYDSVGNLLASANVPHNSNYSNNFDWLQIAPVALLAGATYTISGVSNLDIYGWYGLATNSSLFTFDVADVDYSNTLHDSHLTSLYSGGIINGPNADIQARLGTVPEPMTPVLLGLGLVMLIALRRRLGMK